MLKKLFVVIIASTFIVACGPATEEKIQDENQTPTNEDMNQNDGNSGNPGDMDDNLNREQMDEDLIPNEEDLPLNGNNN